MIKFINHTSQKDSQKSAILKMRECLRAIEKAVLSSIPVTGPSAALPPQGGWSGESTVRSSMLPVE